MEIKLMAGELAKYHNVSKQTLIYYDKIGLLRPQETDPATGYRYYALEQWEDLEIILCLKSLGMSLKEIKTFMTLEAQERVQLLEDQESVIQHQLQTIHAARKRLKNTLSFIRGAMEAVPLKHEIIQADPLPITILPVDPPNDQNALKATLKRTALKARANPHFMIPAFLYQVDDTDPEQTRYIKAAIPTEPENAQETIPPGRWARTFHKGNFSSVRQTRQLLKQFLRKNGHAWEDLSIERLMLSALANPHDRDYIVEIRIRLSEQPQTETP